MTDWLAKAQSKFSKSTPQPAANADVRTLSAATAASHQPLFQISKVAEQATGEFSDQYARARETDGPLLAMGKQCELPPGLEDRLHAMARRWRYTAEDLAEVLELARNNPDGWLRAVSLDERREAEFRAVRLLRCDS